MEKTPKVSGQSGKMPAGRILLILFLTLFTLAFDVIGAGLCYSAHIQEKNCSAEAEGKVIEYRKQKRMFTPVVEYQVGNEIFTGETKAWHSSRTFETGEFVTIGYNPADPEEFYIKSYDLNIITRLGIVLLVTGGVILAVIVAVLILGKNKTETIRAGIIVGGIVLFLFVVFVAVAGLKNTLFIFGGMGLFALYGLFHNKRMEKKE